jgi:glycosyltransferase involved in cell wall biosynthesis
MRPEIVVVLMLGALLFAAWGGLARLLTGAIRNVPLLAEILEAKAAGPLPTLSVVVTARDEAGAIETTLRRLLRQRYPDLEVIVVDDRSTDGTGAILDRLADEQARAAAAPGRARLVVLHNLAVPDGWLGKCHACQLGAGRARSAWVLFMDGDVVLAEDDLLARVVTHAEKLGLDHVALIPDGRPMSALQMALTGVFGQMYLLAARAHEMHRDLPRGGAGVGAFNLMRRAIYERIGGHTLLKMDLADDFKLGRILKESSARQRIYDGAGLVLCRWHRGALNVVRGLEKNFFAGFDFSLGQLLAFTVIVLALLLGPAVCGVLGTLAAQPSAGAWLGAIVASATWLPFAAQASFVLLSHAEQTRRYGGRPLLLAILYPCAVLLLLAAAWNSAFRTLARGGVRWRDTFYPLAALRQGLVPRGIGRRCLSRAEAPRSP